MGRGRPFEKGTPRPANAGRKPGGLNKQTLEVKTAIQLAAYHLGGWERLVAWAMETPQNEYAFWTIIWPKLMPVRLEGTGPRGEIALDVRLTREELERKCADRGLPLHLLFGIDVPTLDENVEGNAEQSNGNRDDVPPVTGDFPPEGLKH